MHCQYPRRCDFTCVGPVCWVSTRLGCNPLSAAPSAGSVCHDTLLLKPLASSAKSTAPRWARRWVWLIFCLFFSVTITKQNQAMTRQDPASSFLRLYLQNITKCSVSTGSLFGSVIRRDTCCFQMNANVSAWKQFSAVWLIRSKQLKQTKYKNSSWSKCNCWSLNCFIVLFFFSFLFSVQFYYKAKSTQT